MADPSKSRRFRVALSFPGEHRSRVEKIAEALADNLGRERVLYDKWLAAELNRVNLDTYLSNLYHEDSDLIAVFLCKEYNAKEWCGLEWRACRDLLKHKRDAQLMFFRLDHADIPGLYSIDGYQDISTMSDRDVAAAILQRARVPGSSSTHRAFTSKLPLVDPTLIGREKWLAALDAAWSDSATNFLQIIASPGTGKTALVDKWFRRHLRETTIFGWSFYSQGTSLDRQTSSDPFFADIIRWFHIDIPPTASIYAKAEAIACHLREQRVLLILDGVEPLQEADGMLRDSALKALLQELATANEGLVVCTTRVRMDIPDDAPRALSIELDDLTQEQGAGYLRTLGVVGEEDELQKASGEYWNNALALTLLGTYLADFSEGDVHRRVEIAKLMAEDAPHGKYARRVITAYEKMFAGKPEDAILRALGYFDRPAESAALKLVLPEMDDRKYRAALKRLHQARLILTTEPSQPIDCHPLVREHFAGRATPEGHAYLYEYYKNQAVHRPDTLEEMTPLFYAVYHGCQAGRHQEALENIFRDRILRSDHEAYLFRKFGAFGTALSLLSNFFEIPWTKAVATLSMANSSWVLSSVAFALRAIGRLRDAVELMRASAEPCVKSGDWENAAERYNNVSELHLTLGNVREAIVAGRQAVDFADRAGIQFLKMVLRTTLAEALHKSGRFAEAADLFDEAEQLQADREPDRPILYSLSGYRYCEFLLGRGEALEVLRRASLTLPWETERLLAIGLDQLSLGCAHPLGSTEAAYHIDQAVDFLRRAGQIQYPPVGLLARGRPHDIDEAFRIAVGSGMRLYLADCHLAGTRLALTAGDLTPARAHLGRAEGLVRETGYHSRDSDLRHLRAELGD